MSGRQAQSSICADCAMGGGGASWMERRPAIAVLDGIFDVVRVDDILES